MHCSTCSSSCQHKLIHIVKCSRNIVGKSVSVCNGHHPYTGNTPLPLSESLVRAIGKVLLLKFSPFTATGLDPAQTGISLDILFIVTGNSQGIPGESPE